MAFKWRGGNAVSLHAVFGPLVTGMDENRFQRRSTSDPGLWKCFNMEWMSDVIPGGLRLNPRLVLCQHK